MRIVGLMSGTSLDGIDAALVRFRSVEDCNGPEWTLEAFVTLDHSDEFRARLLDAIGLGDPAVLARLHTELGGGFADAVHGVCERAGVPVAEVDLVGSHGQTVWHDPPADGRRGATLQLGDPATIAERTGLPVVSDFRARDVAAGGHGAPLAPFADLLLFGSPNRNRAVQNLGGMANVTWVPGQTVSAERARETVLAFDTGPGVALIDDAVRRLTGGARRFDEGGEIARSGQVREDWLASWLSDPFFEMAPPRSTGRERFGARFVERVWHAQNVDGCTDSVGRDLVSTLTAFTVRSIADAYRRWVIPRGVDEVVLVGGGAHNRALVEGLRTTLSPIPVRLGDEAGIPIDAREAIAFALLAWAHERGCPGNLPSVTGASGPRILGSRTPGHAGGKVSRDG